ncbi:Na(+)-translocating NADH-quinone reductase subunit C [Alkalimarinus coralli]|uniref:Na(+)-translocating NADH-quinone reductase subunit C n=1 Tax=Alkalimarinus coralli TaxID=2935863 RepID=UPI00202B96FF|nr:Na(+)-translocating NADH-quinone reductase subunit C [Alkalimarinus coralli]
MSSHKESTQKTIVVALLLCLVCSIVVAASVVLLRPIQEKNKALNLKVNILAAAGILKEGATSAEVEKSFERITAKLVDLETGQYVSPEVVGVTEAIDFDQKKASKNPKLSDALSGEEDIASIKRREKYAKVYLIEEQGDVETIILPIHGYGLWSTLYGFVALNSDANTIAGLGFYQHGETPGLGGEVDNPKWKAQWPGKKIYDLEASQEPMIKLVKGSVDTSKPGAEYGVDGLSGATLTSRGVTNLLHFWLGDNGFQKYLNRLREGA